MHSNIDRLLTLSCVTARSKIDKVLPEKLCEPDQEALAALTFLSR